MARADDRRLASDGSSAGADWDAQVAAILSTRAVLVIDVSPADERDTDRLPLSDADRARADGLKDRRRALFVGTRHAARRALSAWLGCPPRAPEFEAGEDGDPRIVGLPGSAGRIGISFSYAGDRALVALAAGRRIGIDIEACPPPGQPVRRNFSAIREAYFAAHRPPGAGEAEPSPAAFLRDWSRHEAFLKAAGPGIVFPADERDPAAEGFTVIDVDVGPGYVAAAAADGASVAVRMIGEPPRA